MVAEIFPEKEVVESDLLKQLRRLDEATAAGQRGDLDAVRFVVLVPNIPSSQAWIFFLAVSLTPPPPIFCMFIKSI